MNDDIISGMLIGGFVVLGLALLVIASLNESYTTALIRCGGAHYDTNTGAFIRHDRQEAK